MKVRLPRGDRAGPRRTRAAWIFGVLAVLVLLPGAQAHAQIASSDPTQGAVLLAPPAEVVLELTQPIDASTVDLRVVRHDDQEVQQGRAVVSGQDRPVVRIGVDPEAGDGAYTIRLTATSLTDGHRITYTRGFAVGGFAAPETGDGTAFDALGFASRAVAYTGLALVTGAWIMRRRLPDTEAAGRPLAHGGAWLHLAGTVGLLVGARLDAGSVLAVWQGPVGPALLGRLVAALVLLWAVRAVARRPDAWHVVPVAAVAVMFASARFGHAGLSGAWGLPVDLAHFAFAAVWSGGLAVLLVHIGRSDLAGVRRAGLAFSPLAAWTALLVIVTGLLATAGSLQGLWREPRAYLEHAWGQAVLVKVALVLGMLLAALLNRSVLRDPARGEAWAATLHQAMQRVSLGGRPGGAIGLLRGGVALEAVLAAAALVTAAALTTLSPPTAVDLDPETGVHVQAVGREEAIVGLLRMDEAPVLGATRSVSIDLAYAPGFPDAEGPVRDHTCGRDTCVVWRVLHADGASAPVFPVPDGNGTWTAEVYWGTAGDVRVEADVQTQDVFRDVLVFPLHVEGA